MNYLFILFVIFQTHGRLAKVCTKLVFKFTNLIHTISFTSHITINHFSSTTIHDNHTTCAVARHLLLARFEMTNF
jgi:hypothetical protein